MYKIKSLLKKLMNKFNYKTNIGCREERKDNMVRYHIIIKGKVQGVGFRFFTQQQASSYNIKGWVKNKLDGSVEIDAEGDKENMNNFIEDLEKGNGFSRVDSINTSKKPSLKHYSSFSIKY